MGAPNIAGPELSYDISRLITLFESLGENCDFGVVQRAVGVEPFGLFRFAACKPADMVTLLRERFEPLGESSDLWLDEVGATREYWVKSRRFSYETHTDRYAGKDDPDIARNAQIEKIQFLKARLIRDLSRARRLFVFKARCDFETIRALVAQLREYGPNSLLWVNAADAVHPAGSVVHGFEGLLLRFVTHFGSYDGAPSLPVEEWIAVCVAAHRLWRGADLPRVPVDNLIAAATGANTCRWSADPSATTRRCEESSPIGGITFEHELGRADSSSVLRATLPITAGGSFVFSAWIRIAGAFQGQHIGAVFPRCISAAKWGADLKSRQRWQRIWVAATVPLDARIIYCGLIADGGAEEVFHYTSNRRTLAPGCNGLRGCR
jgi:hypothetical protein